ncbi:MAG: hypothetical protein ACKO7Q_01305 [Actinomycetota bacterium]
MRRLPLIAVLALAACALPAGAAAATVPAAFANASVRCAWPVESTPTKANVAYPDSNATYWTTPYVALPGMRITLTGTYPTARFFSVNVYDSSGQDFTVNGAASAITDYEIAPDPGTANPWQTPGAAAGTYTITLRGAVTAATRGNVIPIAPTTPATPFVKGLPKRTGFVTVRVYLPQGGDPSTVPLPTLTYAYPGGKTTTLAQCRRAQTTPSAASQIRSTVMRKALKSLLGGDQSSPPAPATGACATPLVFCRASGGTTPFPNSDSGYVAAKFEPGSGYLTVVRATMPTSAVAYGSGPGLWPATAAGINLRYWSFCTYVYAKPYPVVKIGPIMGCIADQDMPVATGNVATVVISSLADRPAVTREAQNLLGWLPTSAAQPSTTEVIAVRNMLADTGFTASVMNAEPSDPASAQSTMGAYYPTVAQCTTQTFAAAVARAGGGAAGAQAGVAACFQTPASPPAAS